MPLNYKQRRGLASFFCFAIDESLLKMNTSLALRHVPIEEKLKSLQLALRILENPSLRLELEIKDQLRGEDLLDTTSRVFIDRPREMLREMLDQLTEGGSVSPLAVWNHIRVFEKQELRPDQDEEVQNYLKQLCAEYIKLCDAPSFQKEPFFKEEELSKFQASADAILKYSDAPEMSASMPEERAESSSVAAAAPMAFQPAQENATSFFGRRRTRVDDIDSGLSSAAATMPSLGGGEP